MKFCNNCKKAVSYNSQFCTKCGRKVDEQIIENIKKTPIKKKINITIIVLSITFTIFVAILSCAYFYKDDLLAKYYILKAEKSNSVQQTIGYYEKSITSKYSQDVISKIETILEKNEDYDKYLESLKWVLKESDINRLYTSIYISKTKESYLAEDYDDTWNYLQKLEGYGYDITKLEYYENIIDIQAKENKIESEISYTSENALEKEYIIYDSNTRYLTEMELSLYTKEELGYIRNEIFARYGYVFNNENYYNYFINKPWYIPNPHFGGYEEDLNEIENANIELIKELENLK